MPFAHAAKDTLVAPGDSHHVPDSLSNQVRLGPATSARCSPEAHGVFLGDVDSYLFHL